MDRTQLVAMFAAEIVKQQISAGVKHPSPVLIKDAVDTANALVEAFEGVVAGDLTKRLSDQLGQSHDDLAADLKNALSGVESRLNARIDAMVPPKPAADAPVAPVAAPPAPPAP